MFGGFTMGRLDGRVCIVTGAGRGIGAATATMLASEGASVVVNDLGANVDGTGADEGPAADVVAAIKKAGGKAIANYGSVADHQTAENLIKAALDEFGRLDVLVNVAGNLRDRMLFNMTEEEWDSVIAVHLKGTFNTSKFASIYWRQAKEGNYRLINFTSGSGIFGSPGQPNYAAAKLGIVGFTYSCANALARYGVTSNCISPGAATRMTATVPEDRARAMRGGGMMNQEDPERSPDNVARPIVYLASTESSWINGRIIQASGYSVGLYDKPEIIREIAKPTAWTIDELFQQIPSSFRSAIEGGGGMFGGGGQAPQGQGGA